MNMKKQIKYYLEKIENLDNRVYDGLGMLCQFTIDTVEHVRNELQSQQTLTHPLTDGGTFNGSLISLTDDETLIGSLIYELDTVSEVMDKMIPDYAVIQEALEILKEDEEDA